MARTVTLLQLRNDARLYCDNRTSSPQSAHINDVELTRLVNLKLAEVHELLVAARGNDYNGTLDTAAISIVPGTALYSLPDDFMQLAALWIDRGNQEQEEIPNLPSNASVPGALRLIWSRFSSKFYRIRGAQIEFLPTPTETVTANIRYVPAFVDLVEDDDTYDGVNGWEKLVTMGVAMEMRVIERIEMGALAEKYAEQLDRVKGLVDDRQAISPAMVRDVDDSTGWPLGSPRARRWWR